MTIKLITQELTLVQWEQEVVHLIEFLQAKGKHELIVSYGWGCDLDMDDLYQDIPLSLSGLQEWIVQSMKADIFTLGEGTLYIHTQDQEIEIELCHEANIHVTMDNKELAQEIASGWSARGFTYYESSQSGWLMRRD